MAKKYAPVEVKVKRSAAAAAVTGLVLALLSQYVFGGGDVPDLVEGIVTPLISGAVTGGITLGAGWLAKHTSRDVVKVDVED